MRYSKASRCGTPSLLTGFFTLKSDPGQESNLKVSTDYLLRAPGRRVTEKSQFSTLNVGLAKSRCRCSLRRFVLYLSLYLSLFLSLLFSLSLSYLYLSLSLSLFLSPSLFCSIALSLLASGYNIYAGDARVAEYAIIVAVPLFSF
jgi:hypothetical protein